MLFHAVVLPVLIKIEQMMIKYGMEILSEPIPHGSYFSLNIFTHSLKGIIRYFTLAHSIAHNMTQSHNIEHEIYFSSICQKFLPGLSKLILT